MLPSQCSCLGLGLNNEKHFLNLPDILSSMFSNYLYDKTDVFSGTLEIWTGLRPTYKTETPVTPARKGLSAHTGGLEQASLGGGATEESENTRLRAGLLHL